MASWYRPRRRKNIKVKRAKLYKAKSSASSQSIRKIVACKTNSKNRQSYDKVERALENRLNEPLFLFPVDPPKKILDTKNRQSNKVWFHHRKSTLTT